MDSTNMETPPPEEPANIPDHLQFGSTIQKLIELDLEITNANESHGIKPPAPESASDSNTVELSETFEPLISKLQQGVNLQAEFFERTQKQITILNEGLPTRIKEYMSSGADTDALEGGLRITEYMLEHVAQGISRINQTSESLPRAKEELEYLQNAEKVVPEQWSQLIKGFDDLLKNDMALVMSHLNSSKEDLMAIIKQNSTGDEKGSSTSTNNDKDPSSDDAKKEKGSLSTSPAGKETAPPSPDAKEGSFSYHWLSWFLWWKADITCDKLD